MGTPRGQVTSLRSWQAWTHEHQPFELNWWAEHLANGHRTDQEFEDHWMPIRKWIKPQQLIIDIGCGPRPAFVPCVAIDPLIEEYRKLPTVNPEWWHGVMAVAAPAETGFFHLFGKAKTVICWNAIDHAIGWKAILDNMLEYGGNDARFAISTDFWEPFVGHPGFERADFMQEIDKRFVIIEQREPFDRQLALLMRAK
jgi:hypothetical protein